MRTAASPVSAPAVHQARPILEMLCCGLCGAAPAIATMTASPSRKPSSQRRAAAAAAIAAAAAAAAAIAGTGGEGGGESGGEGAAAEAAAAAAAAEAAPVSGPGSDADARSEASGEDAAPSAMLFRSSVTLPAAYFPPERFHTSGVSMPLDVFVGPPLPTEEQAANAACLLALGALHRLGILVRYWPSRLLLAQHLLPRGLAMAGMPEASTPGGPTPGDVPQAPPASPAPSVLSGHSSQAPNAMNFFCPLCNVAATGHKVCPPACLLACRRSRAHALAGGCATWVAACCWAAAAPPPPAG